MRIGLLGMDLAGKKTLFQILSGHGKHLLKKGSVEFAQTIVEDERLAWLNTIYNPKKLTYAQLEFVLAPPVTRESKGSSQALNALHAVDGIICVVQAFSMDGGEDPAPEKDLDYLSSEIIFGDLFKCESMLAKLVKKARAKKDPAIDRERELILKCKAWLESEKPLREMEFGIEEIKTVHSFDFLSMKPVLVLFNIPEDQIGSPPELNSGGFPAEYLSLKIEEEIAMLDPEDQKAFMEEAGLKEQGLKKLIRDSYTITGLISFFTVGDDEVKAWTIPSGTPARTAAGSIHSDIEKGFIRAEVVSYDDFKTAGSEKQARQNNSFRLEGKEYPVLDGDIINFRFNI